MKIHRRTVLIAAAVLVVAGVALAIGHAAKKDKEAKEEAPAAPAEPPLNIAIMLDLSDRLVHTGPNDNVPQWEKDTTIIGYLRDAFIDRQVKKKLMTGDKMRVFCYPTPNIAGISQMQDSLTVDLDLGGGSKLEAVKRNKLTLLGMKATWSRSLSAIYNAAVPVAEHSEGSDVWSYFEQSAKAQCIEPGCRNVLVILTDGYLYHKNSWRKNAAGEYTGIAPMTIDPQKGIVSTGSDLAGLEVLFVEVNPMKPDHFGKMRAMLTDWCHDMGIQQVDVVRTDMPTSNRKSIVNFVFGK